MKLLATTIASLYIGTQATALQEQGRVGRMSRDIWNSLTSTQKTEIATLIFDAMGQAKCLQFFSDFDDQGNEIMANEKDLDEFFNKQREFTAAEIEKEKEAMNK